MLMVAHNNPGHERRANISQIVNSISSVDPKTNDGEYRQKIGLLVSDETSTSSIMLLRRSDAWPRIKTYSSLRFNSSLTTATIASWGYHMAENEVCSSTYRKAGGMTHSLKVLDIILNDSIRQITRLESFKPDGNLYPADIFGQGWSAPGRRQSGDMNFVRNAWEKSKKNCFYLEGQPMSFPKFWKEATTDECGENYVFGNVVSMDIPTLVQFHDYIV